MHEGYKKLNGTKDDPYAGVKKDMLAEYQVAHV